MTFRLVAIFNKGNSFNINLCTDLTFYLKKKLVLFVVDSVRRAEM